MSTANNAPRTSRSGEESNINVQTCMQTLAVKGKARLKRLLLIHIYVGVYLL